MVGIEGLSNDRDSLPRSWEGMRAPIVGKLSATSTSATGLLQYFGLTARNRVLHALMVIMRPPVA